LPASSTATGARNWPAPRPRPGWSSSRTTRWGPSHHVASFAPENSFYFTGLSKSLSPGLRLGFLAMPESLAEAALNRHLSVAWMATPLMAEIAQDWIDSGIADALLAAQRTELAGRNRLAQRLLGNRSHGFLHGLHRWLPLPPGTNEQALLERGLNHDLALAPGAGFAILESPPALRLCLGGPPLRDLERGLERLAELLAPMSPTEP
jgi:DNA-binding transcriptional MocR family regulator